MMDKLFSQQHVDELGMKRCDTSAIFFDCRVIYEGGRETWHFDTISKSSNVQLMGMISFQTPLLSNELYKISALYKKWLGGRRQVWYCY